MNDKIILNLRKKLLQKREEIFERHSQLQSNWQALSERVIELEEEAQKADLTSIYKQLDLRDLEEIEEIDLTLAKIAVGNYGRCESCQQTISRKRIEALPSTRLCQKCAHYYEEKQKKLPRARDLIMKAEMPPEYKYMKTEELREAIFEQLHEAGVDALDHLEISNERGIIYLDGLVPTEKEHRILLDVLTSTMGFTAIIDHLQTEKGDWLAKKTTAAAEDLFEEEEYTEDLFESQESEIPYSLPDRTPLKELIEGG